MSPIHAFVEVVTGVGEIPKFTFINRAKFRIITRVRFLDRIDQHEVYFAPSCSSLFRRFAFRRQRRKWCRGG